MKPGSRSTTDQALRPQVSLVTQQYKRVAGLPDQLPGNPSTGAQAGAYATFDTGSNRAVVARVAVSSVSEDGARANLDAGAAKPFDTMRTAATQTWEKQLNAIYSALSSKLASEYLLQYRSSAAPSSAAAGPGGDRRG